MRGKITLQEIAEAAGVSKFAVSRALSGKPGVSEETRATIVKLAAQMGYFRSPQKRAAHVEVQADGRENWSGTVLVLFPNIRSQNRDSRYWGKVFEGISERLNRKGLDVLTLTEPSTDDMFSLLNPEAIRGIITVGSISTAILLNIYRIGIPVVMVDHWDSAFLSDAVFTDNWSCLSDLTRKLIRKGYTTFQYVGNIYDAHSFHERWEAFRSTLEHTGIEISQNKSLFTAEPKALATALAKIAEQDLPEVFVCADDVTASLMIQTLETLGIDVPNRCGVTGFDDTMGHMPIMATVKVDKELLGIRAVDQLLWRILNPEGAVEKKLIYAEVVVREAYAPPVIKQKAGHESK